MFTLRKLHIERITFGKAYPNAVWEVLLRRVNEQVLSQWDQHTHRESENEVSRPFI